jgi:ribosomal protein L32
MSARSDQVESTQRKMVRCNSCRAAMPEGLFRCPHCGQITQGTEKSVSEDALTKQMRARAAERKEGTCSVCGKRIRKGTVCVECDTKNHRNTFLLIAFVVIVVVLMMMYLFS